MSLLKTSALSILALSIFALAGAADANAGGRQVTVKGSNGYYAKRGYSYDGYNYNRNVHRQGPGGWSVDKHTNCSGGYCSGTRTVTDPYGESYTRGGSVTVERY